MTMEARNGSLSIVTTRGAKEEWEFNWNSIQVLPADDIIVILYGCRSQQCRRLMPSYIHAIDWS